MDLDLLLLGISVTTVKIPFVTSILVEGVRRDSVGPAVSQNMTIHPLKLTLATLAFIIDDDDDDDKSVL